MTGHLSTLGLVLCAALAPQAPALAQTARPAQMQTHSLPRVEGAWVRAAVPGQQGTGAFMRITASEHTQLVAVSTPVAGTAEVHEMKMEGEVMKMRPVPQLDLPSGRTVELKPGGYHVMLMDLKQALKPGSTVPMTLVFRDPAGAERTLKLDVPVAVMPPAGSGGARRGMDMHKD
ncbi:MAG TPA: copper chaperone PCu(A)C [Ramlibacter sp.]|nr:copper chaperone PCu(A)C [Ramlibacter sp.]